MNTQSEALRLADALDFGDSISVKANADIAAAELRRLHAENERKDTIIKSWLRANAVGGWIDDLRSLNAELLESLKNLYTATYHLGACPGTVEEARAAIAKAEEKK